MKSQAQQEALDVAMRAARAGGAIARERMGKPGYLKWKGHRDVVSEASFQVQDAIVSTLEEMAYAREVVGGKGGPTSAPAPPRRGN